MRFSITFYSVFICRSSSVNLPFILTFQIWRRIRCPSVFLSVSCPPSSSSSHCVISTLKKRGIRKKSLPFLSSNLSKPLQTIVSSTPAPSVCPLLGSLFCRSWGGMVGSSHHTIRIASMQVRIKSRVHLKPESSTPGGRHQGLPPGSGVFFWSR